MANVINTYDCKFNSRVILTIDLLYLRTTLDEYDSVALKRLATARVRKFFFSKTQSIFLYLTD